MRHSQDTSLARGERADYYKEQREERSFSPFGPISRLVSGVKSFLGLGGNRSETNMSAQRQVQNESGGNGSSRMEISPASWDSQSVGFRRIHNSSNSKANVPLSIIETMKYNCTMVFDEMPSEKKEQLCQHYNSLAKPVPRVNTAKRKVHQLDALIETNSTESSLNTASAQVLKRMKRNDFSSHDKNTSVAVIQRQRGFLEDRMATTEKARRNRTEEPRSSFDKPSRLLGKEEALLHFDERNTSSSDERSFAQAKGREPALRIQLKLESDSDQSIKRVPVPKRRSEPSPDKTSSATKKPRSNSQKRVDLSFLHKKLSPITETSDDEIPTTNRGTQTSPIQRSSPMKKTAPYVEERMTFESDMRAFDAPTASPIKHHPKERTPSPDTGKEAQKSPGLSFLSPKVGTPRQSDSKTKSFERLPSSEKIIPPVESQPIISQESEPPKSISIEKVSPPASQEAEIFLQPKPSISFFQRAELLQQQQKPPSVNREDERTVETGIRPQSMFTKEAPIEAKPNPFIQQKASVPPPFASKESGAMNNPFMQSDQQASLSLGSLLKRNSNEAPSFNFLKSSVAPSISNEVIPSGGLFQKSTNPPPAAPLFTEERRAPPANNSFFEAGRTQNTAAPLFGREQMSGGAPGFLNTSNKTFFSAVEPRRNETIDFEDHGRDNGSNMRTFFGGGFQRDNRETNPFFRGSGTSDHQATDNSNKNPLFNFNSNRRNDGMEVVEENTGGNRFAQNSNGGNGLFGRGDGMNSSSFGGNNGGTNSFLNRGNGGQMGGDEPFGAALWKRNDKPANRDDRPGFAQEPPSFSKASDYFRSEGNTRSNGNLFQSGNNNNRNNERSFLNGASNSSNLFLNGGGGGSREVSGNIGGGSSAANLFSSNAGGSGAIGTGIGTGGGNPSSGVSSGGGNPANLGGRKILRIKTTAVASNAPRINDK